MVAGHKGIRGGLKKQVAENDFGNGVAFHRD